MPGCVCEWIRGHKGPCQPLIFCSCNSLNVSPVWRAPPTYEEPPPDTPPRPLGAHHVRSQEPSPASRKTISHRAISSLFSSLSRSKMPASLGGSFLSGKSQAQTPRHGPLEPQRPAALAARFIRPQIARLCRQTRHATNKPASEGWAGIIINNHSSA